MALIPFSKKCVYFFEFPLGRHQLLCYNSANALVIQRFQHSLDGIVNITLIAWILHS